MTVKIWAITGTIYHVGLIIFHLTFWKIFHWKDDLISLTVINRSVMQVFNICLMFIFFVFSYITAFHYMELMTTPLGNNLLFLISLFWLLRSLLQIWFFGLKNKISLLLFMIFMLGCIIYLLPFTRILRITG